MTRVEGDWKGRHYYEVQNKDNCVKEVKIGGDRCPLKNSIP